MFEDDESIALTSNQGGQHQAKAIMASKATARSQSITDTNDEVFEDDESIALTSNQGRQHQAKAIMASKAKGLALYIVVCNHNHYWCKVGRTTQSKKALRSRYYFAYYSWMTYF